MHLPNDLITLEQGLSANSSPHIFVEGLEMKFDKELN
jgi:hypothetical protein